MGIRLYSCRVAKVDADKRRKVGAMAMNQYNISNMGQEEVAICESAAVVLRAFRKSGVEVSDKLFIYGVGRIS